MYFCVFDGFCSISMIFSNFEALTPPQSLSLPPVPPLEGPSALKYRACQQNQAFGNSPGGPGGPGGPGEMVHGPLLGTPFTGAFYANFHHLFRTHSGGLDDTVLPVGRQSK